MSSFPSRRDFLKLAGLVPLSLVSGPLAKLRAAPASAQNVIVVVFDALSAYHLSIYGYRRETMPNLTRLAKRAIVYHNHFAAGNYTTPGTASLLTGTYPWTHRALESDTGVVERFLTRNLFSAFPDYYRAAYTHNPWANTLLDQFKPDIQDLMPWRRLFLRPSDGLIGSLFARDQDAAFVGWARDISMKDYGYAYSLFLSHIYQAAETGQEAVLRPYFPRGIPTIEPDDDFLLEQAIDWTRELLATLPQPFLGYFHYLPPHAPYRTAAEFFNRFRGDGFTPVFKPEDAFTQRVAPQVLLRKRTEYDEFILYVDREFGRLFDSLEASGLLKNTWVLFTSDHGEMFERGQVGHGNPSLCQAVVRVPLLILEPGRETGVDVHALTSAVDVLPTLAHLTGRPIPDWSEGQILPPFAAPGPDSSRVLYAVQARHNARYGPLTSASTMLVQDRYKLIYCFGYPDRGVKELVQLYDIRTDPEELVDLSISHKALASEMLQALKAKIKEEDQPYL